MNRRTTALFSSVDMSDATWGKWLGSKYGPADDPAQAGVVGPHLGDGVGARGLTSGLPRCWAEIDLDAKPYGYECHTATGSAA